MKREITNISERNVLGLDPGETRVIDIDPRQEVQLIRGGFITAKKPPRSRSKKKDDD